MESFYALKEEKENRFCSGDDNVNDCITYMNQELQVHGFQALQTSSENSRTLTIELLNHLYVLLQQHRHDMKIREDLQDKLLRSNSDMQTAQRSQKLYKDELDKSLRENQSISEQNRQLEEKIKSLNSKLKGEKDEFMSDKNQAKKAGMDVLNSLQNPNGKRAVWKTKAKDDEEMYQSIVCGYEDKVKDLIMENSTYRDFANSIYSNLVRLQWKFEGKHNLAEAADENLQQLDPNILPDGIFQLPLEMSRDSIETTLQNMWDNFDKAILSSLKQTIDTAGQNLDANVNEIDSLKLELQECLLKISERDKVIHEFQNAQSDIKNDTHVLNESLLYAEKEEVENLKAELRKQKESLEKERALVAEAAVKLNRERKEFESDRVALLEAQIGASPLSFEKSQGKECDFKLRSF
ncbi:uncharacterized protein TRIADDRAFT_58152 [Trichoplax adhaerens]|uniref:Uncharacterized protein n=1 Tax=Trichoplax adhaerens TaxID=10228 RepID=B3S108_TRIAD|nr:hypothetical protein TRIADDRAFT_58152 [Trichoplax adhaerens]EDV23484.1 hypothetical protein TRIADDRAFT_58152 [Trichoplax adhaerens]|eukprot:XP_002114394.1 hypothetical protein TRIADDRAFT_58152 [Trichoplax adhaerens]